MTGESGGWDDLDDVPAPDSPPIRSRVDWAAVTAALSEGATIGREASETTCEDHEPGHHATQSEADECSAETYGEQGFDGALESDTPDRLGQPVASEPSVQESSDALTLFGAPEQFHVAWQHWNGMPEFHMDDLSPDSTLIVKFRTPEDREAFAALIGRTIRREESRGIWFPEIRIAHFWDKRYRDATAVPVDNTPVLSEAEEVLDEDISDEETA
jgi:hypothetical protein